MKNLSSHARELLEIQQQKYLGSLPQKHARIRRCWEKIQREGLTPVNAEQLRLQVHRLAGSAGSYGLQDLGRAAKQLDMILGSGECEGLDTLIITGPMVELLNQFNWLDS